MSEPDPAPRPSPRYLPWLAVPLVVALLVAAWLVWVSKSAPRPTTSHADVMVEPGGRLVRTQGGNDEIIELEGRARFQVLPLLARDRLRIRAGGDVLEVRGNAFVVDADASGFRSVSVSEGAVEVKPACCALVKVSAGESWVRAVAPAASGSR